MRSYEHWRCEIDGHHILWAHLDKKNASVNTLNPQILKELEEIIESIEADKSVVALIIKSDKSAFIAGADIELFRVITSKEEALEFISLGQSVYTKLENMTIPTVAMIQGFCLGGGLELALSCKYRIAESSPKTVLGLPEVKLGINPGWGGTIRLPRLVGIFKAMDLILSGRAVKAKEAQKMGLVDYVVPKRLLNQVAVKLALDPSLAPNKSKLREIMGSLLNNPLSRRPLASFFRSQLRKKIQPEHYPAPFEIVNNWEKWGVMDPRAMQEEARLISRLVVSSTSRNLVHVFFLQEQLKGLVPKGKHPIHHVHVIGAGTMGGDIAGWCALNGLEVTLQDQAPALLASAIKRTYTLASKKLKEKHLIQAVMDRLTPDPTGIGLAKADVIIEAITENLEAKQQLFRKIEPLVKEDAILATNTSTIPIEEIARALKRREKLLGFHFFNPVSKMPLVEIVCAQETDDSVIEKAMAFARTIDKLPLPVKSSPGFLVNRILLPYMLEAMILLEEGVPMEVIDQAAVNFGMPVGPLELADMVGLDVCLAAGQKMSQYLDDAPATPAKLQSLVEQGHLGCKTNKGFYEYKKGRLQKQKQKNPNLALEQDVANRLIGKMANEALACLDEGVVSEPAFIDAGSIFGFGFAPFRGGLMSYINSQKV